MRHQPNTLEEMVVLMEANALAEDVTDCNIVEVSRWKGGNSPTKDI